MSANFNIEPSGTGSAGASGYKAMNVLTTEQAIKMGYSEDKRKRRRQHRAAAKKLLQNGGFFNGYSAPGSSFWWLAQWHKEQARAL